MLRAALTLLLLITAALPARAADLSAVITQVQGSVTVAGSGAGPVPLATPWQVILPGARLHLPEGAGVGIACSNLRFVRLSGPVVSWSLSEASCAVGKELTRAEFDLVAPQAGRFKVVHGLLLLEREMRSDTGEDPLAPVVLTPRNATSRSPRPTVAWLGVPSATEFSVEWTGPRGSSYSRRLETADLACATGPGGFEMCSVPWPADRADLPPGETFFLTVAAREGIVEPWHRADPVQVRTLSLQGSAALESRLRGLADLGFSGAALDVARAGLLAQNEIYEDAAEAYRRALAAAPTPELRVTLADLYLTVGLYRLADPLYRGELAAETPAVRAAATFGSARIEYARGHYKEAAERFRQAEALYRGLAMSEDATAAEKAAKKAAGLVPPPAAP